MIQAYIERTYTSSPDNRFPGLPGLTDVAGRSPRKSSEIKLWDLQYLLSNGWRLRLVNVDDDDEGLPTERRAGRVAAAAICHSWRPSGPPTDGRQLRSLARSLPRPSWYTTVGHAGATRPAPQRRPKQISELAPVN